MQYYISNNEVFDHASSLTYNNETLYDINAPEIQAIINPPIPVDEQAAQIRATIEALLPKISHNLMLHDESVPGAIATRADWVTFLTALWAIHEDIDSNVAAATLPTEPS